MAKGLSRTDLDSKHSLPTLAFVESGQLQLACTAGLFSSHSRSCPKFPTAFSEYNQKIHVVTA